jgi:hypothetical protein
MLLLDTRSASATFPSSRKAQQPEMDQDRPILSKQDPGQCRPQNMLRRPQLRDDPCDFGIMECYP